MSGLQKTEKRRVTLIDAESTVNASQASLLASRMEGRASVGDTSPPGHRLTSVMHEKGQIIIGQPTLALRAGVVANGRQLALFGQGIDNSY